MRFILSALLATALLGALATADTRQGQQASFHLEPRHDHQQNGQKVDHSHHQKSSSCKQRRNLRQQKRVALVAPAVPKADATNFRLNKKIDHSQHKKVDHSHHKKSSSRSSLNKRQLDRLTVHFKKTKPNKHLKASSSRKTQLRDSPIELLHRKKVQKRELAKKKTNKKVAKKVNKKISRNRKTRELGGEKKKVEKRDLAKKRINKKANKKVAKNADTELAFHRKISRNRKTRELGQQKKNIKKRDVTPETLVLNDQEYSIIRAQEDEEPIFETQDIKEKKNTHKHHNSSPKKKKAQGKKHKD
ncbi:hypothetical protein BGX28_007627 [Mortierella sp. GBA30]|nr:hypothetical protein BGX28_007627 [Mortierella sp. GBA30]